MRPHTRALVALATLLDRLPARRKTVKPSPVLITGDLRLTSGVIAAARIAPGVIKTADLAPAKIKTGSLSVNTIGAAQ